MASEAGQMASSEGYTARLLAYAGDGRRRGRLEQPEAGIELENPVCGDQLRLEARRGAAGELAEMRFECQGCLAARAAAAALTELLEGATLEQAARVDEAALRVELGELPYAAAHALSLAIEGRDRLLDALRSRIAG